jgi:GNAT superfamily N-acetyltransferase
VADAEGIARVHTLSWQAAYRDLVPAEYLDTLAWEPRALRWGQQLAEPACPGGAVVVAVDAADSVHGFANVGQPRDDALRDRDVGELYALYLAPTLWRRGVGTRLL